LPGKGSPKRDKGKVCPFGRKVIESKLKYGFGCPKSASRKECEDILCNTRLKPLIIQRFLKGWKQTDGVGGEMMEISVLILHTDGTQTLETQNVPDHYLESVKEEPAVQA
jgi:hypothetical protein